MFCWKCKTKVDLSNKKVSFRGMCPHCEADLHVCKNCRYYTPGKPNDCMILTVDPVLDKEKFNFCEDFRPLEKLAKESTIKKEDVAKRLFQDSNDDASLGNDFGSLFKD